MSSRRWARVAVAGLGLAALAASVTSPIARADGRVVKYIALGDSFTAAPLSSKPSGTPGGSMGFDGADNPYTCGQSNTNYPRLIARWLGLYTPLDEASEVPIRSPHPEFVDASCSGARTNNMDDPQSAPFNYGTNKPQFDAFIGIDASKVELVSIGIGGNDVGFGDLQTECVEKPNMPGGSACSANSTLTNKTHSAVLQLRAKVSSLVLRIHEDLAPEAKILVFGYPALLPEPPLVDGLPDGCWPYIPILPEDVSWLRQVQMDLNNAISFAVQDANGDNGDFARYVDWYTPSIGHDMCKPPGRAWVNGIILAPPSFPVHPNVLGSAGAARAGVEVLTALGFKRGGLLGSLGVLP